MYAQLNQFFNLKPEKNSGFNNIPTHDFCDTGAVLDYQLSYQAKLELVTLWVDFVKCP